MTASPPVTGDIAFDSSCISDLPTLVSLVEHTCRQVGADDDTVFSLRLAVEEVFTNILDYGYPGSSGPINIHIEARPGQVRVSFADAAPRFDPATVATPRLDVPLEDRQVGGWGWHFVRQAVDRVDWEPREEGGNLLTLTKSLPAASSTQPGASLNEH